MAGFNMPSDQEMLIGGQPVQYSGNVGTDATTVSCDGIITGLYVNNCDAADILHLSFDGGTTWFSIPNATYNVGPFSYMTQSFQFKGSAANVAYELSFGVVGSGS